MKRLFAPLDVQIELTENCNQKCIHCYNYWRYKQKIDSNELNNKDFLFILEKLNNLGVSVITLTGGEPFLRKDLFFALLKQAKKYKMEVGLNSNAVLIKENDAKLMADIGIDHALISILGDEDTHDFITGKKLNFKKAILGISNLIKNDIKTAINIVASKLNQNEIYTVAKKMKNLGVKTFCATPMVPAHKNHLPYILNSNECKNVLKTLLKIKEDFNYNIDTLEPIARCLFNENEEDDFLPFFGNRICSAAVSSCAISSKGNVRPCIHADKEFGNLLKEDFNIIWQKMSFWASPDILPTECKSCEANPICEGGCRMSAKLIYGKYNEKDMYMVKPINNLKRAKKLPQINLPEITENTLLKINPECRFRKEIFGGIFYVGNNVEFCTDNGINFINNLKTENLFTAKILEINFNYSVTQLIPVLKRLIKNKIILSGEGSFNEVLKNYRFAKSKAAKIGVCVTIDHHNLFRLKEIIPWFSDYLNIKGMGFNILIENKESTVLKQEFKNYSEIVAEQLIECFKILREKGIYEDRMMRRVKNFISKTPVLSDCGGCGLQMVVSPDGKIGVCQAFCGTKEYFIDTPFETFEPGSHIFWKEWRKRSPLSMKQCINCIALGNCGGGCPYNAYKKLGTIWALDERFCVHAKKSVEFLIKDLWEKRKIKQ